MEDNMSNLTSSGEATTISVSSSTHIYTPLIHDEVCFGDLPKDINENIEEPPAKKRRNLPGNPDPNAEVIALSPKSLLATNKFLCEICNKGFQRDQNLQLHRRGHNLPWKLKQRTNNEIRKKVYICPEVGCIHHDPLRALGDLTGIKKHFSRKHGEKKWKCEKCSKKYAVQSDWKAHSKTCGTREYRCDCGTLFTRRDSFITHRAFCEALAEESARSTPLILTPSNIPFPSSPRVTPPPLPHHHHQLPPWLSFSPPIHPIFPSPLDLNGFTNPQYELPQYELKTLEQNPDLNPNPFAHMSATALLQKAAQMGAKMSNNMSIFAPNMCNLEGSGSVHVGEVGGTMEAHSLLIQDNMTNSLSSPSPSTFVPFEDRTNTSTFCGLLNSKEDGDMSFHEEGMTRDFLGLRPITNSDFLSFVDHAQESWED